jgi:hypothetical protein
MSVKLTVGGSKGSEWLIAREPRGRGETVMIFLERDAKINEEMFAEY